MRGKGSRLGEPCPKVRLSQDRMPIEPLSQQQSWARGEGGTLELVEISINWTDSFRFTAVVKFDFLVANGRIK